MGRPKHVEDAAKIAEDLQKKLYGNPEEPPTTDEPPIDVAPEEPPVDTVGTPVEPEPPDPTTELSHKLEVLEGRYRAETKRLEDMVSKLSTELATRAAPVAPVAPVEPDESENYIKELESEYPSLYNGINALINKVATEKISKPSQVIDGLVKKVQMTDQERYYAGLAKRIPDWEAINSSPKFLEYLATKDRFTGLKRHDLLMNAFQNMNVEATSAFFEDFKEANGMVDAEVIPPQPAVQEPSEPETRPGKVPRPTARSGQYVTRADITKFYQDKAMRRLTGTKEEIAKMEARILQAVKEGRVR
jgi:hypothetical protein